ncbi:hypothetical protein CMV_003674 [Castanea mollissima]|uniref:Uncharacterized protein n=1 Tax=Castanea mollissima TaxID=60419 RepID=A0A8J4RZY7_9ROSI|nr:hypothetical protein CMV_003674 [Castanea mollissima]
MILILCSIPFFICFSSSFGENSFFEVELQSPKKPCKLTFLLKISLFSFVSAVHSVKILSLRLNYSHQRNLAKTFSSCLAFDKCDRQWVAYIVRTNGLNNHGLVGFQWQIMKEQDEDLEKLKETVTRTKHISLAVNEKLSLHTRILETWTSMWTQRIPTYRTSLALGLCPCIHAVVVYMMHSCSGWLLCGVFPASHQNSYFLVSGFKNRKEMNRRQHRTNGLNNHGLVGFEWQIMKG